MGHESPAPKRKHLRLWDCGPERHALETNPHLFLLKTKNSPFAANTAVTQSPANTSLRSVETQVTFKGVTKRRSLPSTDQDPPATVRGWGAGKARSLPVLLPTPPAPPSPTGSSTLLTAIRRRGFLLITYN